MVKILIAFLASFLFSLLLMPLIIKIIKKHSASQTILSYVKEHKNKNGTPTMGGVVFMLCCLLAFMFLKFNLNWFIVVTVSVFFGLLGLMDDYIKVKYKQNLGLRAYQKIIGQFGISLVFAIFVYFSTQGGKIFIPFTSKIVDIGIFIVPLIMLVLIATTNSVNLTDGIDGLAGSVSFVYLVFFVAISLIVKQTLYLAGETGEILTNMQNICVLSALMAGSVLGFLMFNTNKASIFMGDAGSLCLGGFVGASACMLGQQLLIPILGFCFVFSALSVILQVAVYKLKHKRVFKMAPFHHHLQMSGLTEPKIVAIYSATTILLGITSVILYLI